MRYVIILLTLFVCIACISEDEKLCEGDCNDDENVSQFESDEQGEFTDQDSEPDDENEKSDQDADSQSERPDLGEHVLLYEDFELSSTYKKWKEVNIIKMMDGGNPFLYSPDLWGIGKPTNCKVTQPYSGENVMATKLDGMLPQKSSSNVNSVILSNVIYYDEPVLIPSTGAYLEFYAYVDTALISGKYYGGMMVYLCESPSFTEGGKCSKLKVDNSRTKIELSDLTSNPAGYVNDFMGAYSFNEYGVAGDAEPNAWVKFSANIGPEAAGRNNLLMFEYTQDGHGNPDNCGIYIDDIILVKN